MSVKSKSWLYLTGIVFAETFQAEMSNSGLFNGAGNGQPVGRRAWTFRLGAFEMFL